MARFSWHLFDGTGFGGSRGGSSYAERKKWDFMQSPVELAKHVLKKWFGLMRSEATEEKLFCALVKCEKLRAAKLLKEELKLDRLTYSKEGTRVLCPKYSREVILII